MPASGRASPATILGASIIKTTARFQDAEQPLKQKPIIQIDPAAPLQHYENLARASIDSGRDNPFRPDGKIYKSADPIVDYYKYGPNQSSRAQSPTDSKLLVGPSSEDGSERAADSKKSAKKRTKKWRRSGEPAAAAAALEPASDAPQAGRCCRCWRRWLSCCCCCCCACGRCKRNSTGDDGATEERRTQKEQEFDAGQYSSPPSVDAKTKDFKRSKIVVLQSDSGCHSERQSILAPDGGGADGSPEPGGFIAANRGQLAPPTPKEATLISGGGGGGVQPVATEPKRTRCVVS